MTERFLIVRVGEHRVALIASSLVEVSRAVALRRVPGSVHAMIAGVCNLRGKAAVVLDLRGRFGLPTPPPRPRDAIVFVRSHDRHVGLLVDAIDDFLDLDTARLVPARDVSAALGDRCRLAATADGVHVIIDVAGFVTASELDAVSNESAP